MILNILPNTFYINCILIVLANKIIIYLIINLHEKRIKIMFKLKLINLL